MRTRSFWCLIATWLGIVGLVSTACTEAPTSTPQTLSPQPQDRIPIVTAVETTRGIRSRLITAQPLGAFWRQDGQIVVFAESGQDPMNSRYMWYAFDTATGKRSVIEPPIVISPQIWAQLEAIRPVPEDSLWFQGAISPSRMYIIYGRLQPGYTPPPGKRRFPFEIWIAKTDGTGARKLGEPTSCGYLARVIWFDQERKAVIECSNDGPPDIYMADIEHHSITEFSKVTAFKGSTSFGSFTMSPDGTKLAITDLAFELQVVPLDGSEIRSVAKWGYEPRWSPDSRRLYYQQGKSLDNCHGASIHVFDLAIGTDRVVLESPVSTSENRQLNVECGGPFEVSPRENAAVVRANGLWLIEWSQ